MFPAMEAERVIRWALAVRKAVRLPVVAAQDLPLERERPLEQAPAREVLRRAAERPVVPRAAPLQVELRQEVPQVVPPQAPR